MSRFPIFVAIAILLLTSCGGRNTSGRLEVRDAWARAAMTSDNGAAYMVISNGTDVQHELIGVSSDSADAVEMHLSKMENDVMQMIPQESVLLPAGGDVEFKPGGLHIMLIDLKHNLEVGGEITLTLMFKDHADITLTVPVKDAADLGGSGMDGHQMP
jgi:hypothetical protein